jgi:NADPH:quinone reductase-like Zn-dependent oxidoreductase
MKAVQFGEYGGIDVLKVAEVPLPAPGRGQVLVQVKGSARSPCSWPGGPGPR